MDRDPKSDLTQAVCLRLCSYYKPGRNEELACRGYLVLERLALRGVPMRRRKGGATAGQDRLKNC